MRVGVLATAAMGALLTVWACRDWDRYDPRLGPDGVGAAGGGAGAEGGAGGENGGAGGGGGGEGGAGPACGTTDMLGDDFADGVSTPVWQRDFYNGSGISETGGELVMSFDGTLEGEASYSTRAAFDLRDRAISIEVTERPGGADAAVALFARFGEHDYGEIKFTADTVYFYLTAGPIDDELASQLYDPQKHRFMRFRADGEALHMETSGDGTMWNEGASVDLATLGHTPQYTSFELYAHADTATEVHLDNLGGGVKSSEPFCPAGTLQDAFDGSAFSDAWNAYSTDPPCSILLDQGQVVTHIESGQQSSCSRTSAAAYDLADGAVSIELVSLPSATEDTYVDWKVGTDPNNMAVFSLSMGLLHMEHIEDAEYFTVGELPFNPMAHRFLRFRHAEGQLHYEVSADGVSWDSLASVTSFFDPGRARVAWQVGADTPTVDVEARFDNYNLLP